MPRYGVNIVHNEKYNVYNNIYSIYLVRDLLGDTYVVEGDVYLHNNIFLKPTRKSSYFSVMRFGFEKEWILDADADGRVTGIRIADGDGYIMSGVYALDRGRERQNWAAAGAAHGASGV